MLKRTFRRLNKTIAPTACYFCQKGIKEIDYKNTVLLRRFISGQAKISAPKRSGICKAHQRQLARAIKRARYLALLPFTNR